jgi:uncharacterized delta-60 repeat protein
VLVCGRAQVGGIFRFMLARFDANGALDDAFGTHGLVTTSFADQGDFAKALVVQPDGKIVVAGQSSNFGANPDFAVSRYLPTGALDTAFGGTGKVTIDFFGKIDGAVAVAAQPDGMLVLGGSARNGASTVFAMSRLAP